MRTVTIDIETTGIPPKGADYKIDFMNYPYIVSIAWKINNGPVEEFIINQEGRLMSEEAIGIHGITNEIANASPYKLLEILIKLANLKNCNCIVGHNIFFDTSIIKANSYRLHIRDLLEAAILPDIEEFLHKDKRIDTMRLCHKLFGGKWPTLSEAYFKLFNEEFKAHSAGSDVEAAHRIYLELERRGLIPVKSPVLMEEE